jgi:hypothetical protein
MNIFDATYKTYCYLCSKSNNALTTVFWSYEKSEYAGYKALICPTCMTRLRSSEIRDRVFLSEELLLQAVVTDALLPENAKKSALKRSILAT